MSHLKRPVMTCLCLALVLCGCSRGGPEGKRVKRGEKRMSVALETHDGGFFAVQKPRGWKVETTGRCSDLGFVSRDPAQPFRQVFWFNRLGPFQVGPTTPEDFLLRAASLVTNPPAPFLGDVQIVSSVAVSGTAARIIRAVLRDGDQAGEGFFAVELLPAEDGAVYAIGFAGIAASQPEFAPLHEVYARCLESFSISRAHVEDCREKEATSVGAITNSGEILRAVGRGMSEAWSRRRPADDVAAVRKGDEIRGIERFYDPATHAVYGFPKGFYEPYRAATNAHHLTGLQPLPDDVELWLQPALDGAQFVK